MASEWKKLVEEAEKTKSEILKSGKYNSAGAVMGSAIKSLKKVELRLYQIENPEASEIQKNPLTLEGIRMIEEDEKFSIAIGLLHEKYGIDYVDGPVMAKCVSGKGKPYEWYDDFTAPRTKAFNNGVFYKVKRGPGFMWKINPIVVRHLK